MRLLVVAAFEPELTEVRELLRGVRGFDVAIAAVGVGVVEAAIGMTRAIAEHRPSHALLLGTCGAFVPDAGGGSAVLEIGDVVTSPRATLLDGALVESRAELPGPMPRAVDLPLHGPIVDAGATLAEIANTIGITVDDTHAARLRAMIGRATSPAVEHLEAFAFARACVAHDVLAGVVLGVANMVGAQGRVQWRSHHAAASANAARVAIRACEALRS